MEISNLPIDGETPHTADAPKTVEVSDSAVERITTLLKDEPAGTVFRISVLGGGCSGFQYLFDLDTKGSADDDHVVTRDGATVAVDTTSLDLLAGAMLDYVEELGHAGFEMKNPNAVAGCGCGNSFSV